MTIYFANTNYNGIIISDDIDDDDVQTEPNR